MDYKKLVESLEKMLPPKIPYGELVGAPWPYTGQGEMVYEEPESYFIEQAITAITDLLARAEAAEARAEKAERERDYAIKQLKIAADENGGCWGCKWFDDMTEKCTNPEGMVSCSTVTNNMWEWRGLKEE